MSFFQAFEHYQSFFFNVVLLQNNIRHTVQKVTPEKWRHCDNLQKVTTNRWNTASCYFAEGFIAPVHVNDEKAADNRLPSTMTMGYTLSLKYTRKLSVIYGKKMNTKCMTLQRKPVRSRAIKLSQTWLDQTET